MATDREEFYSKQIYGTEFARLTSNEKRIIDKLIQRAVEELNTNSLQQEII